jgi:hypothetical protein
MQKRVALLISCIFLLAVAASAQTDKAQTSKTQTSKTSMNKSQHTRPPEDKTKRPSPPAGTLCKFADGKTITVDFSSPRVKGRKIFGGLEPYGQPWRIGANEATTFVTTADLMVGDKQIPAGSYTIFAIPNADKWTLIISKKTGEWGIPYPGEAQDFARTDMKITSTPALVEDMIINFDPTGDSCAMHVKWENTDASVNITEKK